jgi:hypothetical protein
VVRVAICGNVDFMDVNGWHCSFDYAFDFLIFFFFTFLTLLIIPNWTEVLSKLS